jgi:hypothetical protein
MNKKDSKGQDQTINDPNDKQNNELDSFDDKPKRKITQMDLDMEEPE